jgi:hypothetical protein
MPIRINLLAEAQAAEESRRKDPVKRAALVAVCLVFLIALWSSALQFKIMRVKSELTSIDSKWRSIQKDYQEAVECQRKAIEADQKLSALQQLTTNRFLWGTVLNAFQQTLNGLDDVQVVHLKTEQLFTQNEETKARTNDSRVIPGRPASATERVTLKIDAMDTSTPFGSRVSKFKESIAHVPWFRDSLEKTNGVKLISRGAPQTRPDGKGYLVLFSLEAYFPDKTR